MSKSYISLNEINLDTLVDYVDKSVITSGVLTPHVNALRDYYFNSDINFIINNKLTPDDLNNFILCIDSIYSSDSTSGTLEEGNAKYTIKIKTSINYVYDAEQATELPNNIVAEEVTGTVTDENKYTESHTEILDLVEVLILNNEIISVIILGKDNNKMFELPTASKVSDYLKATESVSCRYIKTNTGNYKLEISDVRLPNYPTNVSVTDFNTFKNILDNKYKFEVTAYIPRGSLLLEEKSKLSDKDTFMSNLQNCYENGYTLSDVSKVSPYRADYLTNTKLNIQGMFDLYSEENRLYQEYLIGENKNGNYFRSFGNYEQVILYKPSTITASNEKFNIETITPEEATRLLKEAEDVGPYIRLKEYERFSTIDERYIYLLKEKIRDKQINKSNTTSLRTPVGNISNKTERVIQYKPTCKSDFKEYLTNLLSFYFYNDIDERMYEIIPNPKGLGKVEKKEISFSKYLQSHHNYYYNKIHNAVNTNNKYDNECNEIKIYTIYYNDDDQSEIFKSIVADLKNGWRFL